MLDEQNASLPELTCVANSRLSSIVLTPNEVQLALKSLPTGKASGPNGINNRVLKELAMEISLPLCTLFNLSLQTGIVPESHKEGNVCSIFKKDDPSLPRNYRPITLLNSEDKVFERLVFKYLYNHLRDNNILTSSQSGFIPGDSTVNQLTYLYDTICRALDNGKEVRAVFCDISKAFDLYGTPVLFTNLRQQESLALCSTGSGVISLTGNKELFFLVLLQTGFTF